MKTMTSIAGVLLIVSVPAAAANPEKDAVKTFIKSVKQGADLVAAYPGAVSAKESASLRRVASCTATNLMKQSGGYFTTVWNCGSKGALGMKVTLQDARISRVETFSLEARPNAERR